MKPTTEETPSSPAAKPGHPAARWLKRLGLVGFLFFFAKGMVWLAIFALGAKGVATVM